MAQVTIIIVNWNTKNLIHDCIQSLNKSEIKNELEVIVVDNNSSDGSQTMICEEFPWVQLIENDTNRGFAAACNQGLDQAKGDYYLLLNSDTRISNNVITKCVEFMENVPDAGAMGCKLLYNDGETQPSCFNFISLSRILYEKCVPGSLKNLFPHRIREQFEVKIISWSYDTIRTCDYIMGSFLFLRRDAIEDVGSLDERFFMYAGEADMCLRLWNKGWKVYYVPEISAFHEKGGSSKKIKAETEIQQIASRGLFMKKHYATSHYMSYFIFSLIYNVLLYILYKFRYSNEMKKDIYYGKATVILNLIHPYKNVHGKAAIKGELVKAIGHNDR